VTADEIESYLHGQCHLFAVALHKVTGLPLRAAVGWSDDIDGEVLVHAWVETPEGRVVDAAGFRSYEDVLETYGEDEDPVRCGMTEKGLVLLGEGRKAPRMRRLNKALEHATELAESLGLTAAPAPAP
jgi:hypothetical protein